MYSRASQQILFVEAEEKFVDLVVGFLTLTIGCAIKLLSESERFSMDPTAISTESNLGLHSHECVCLRNTPEVRTFKSTSNQQQLLFLFRYCRCVGYPEDCGWHRQCS